MKPDKWRRVEQLFNDALAIQPSERDAWLKAACDDAEVCDEVRSLLAADVNRSDDLEKPVQDAIRALDGRHSRRRIGPYELQEQIGSGGMGTVYRAIRVDEEYRSTVAIKLVRPGMDTEFILNRFRRERQTLARLSHPSIARLLDGGTTDTGIPYIVMEFINGQWITDYCAGRRSSLRERLQLFLPVCSAVDYAHRNFVVHRDIKPGNILIDQTGTPKLLDFGVCKLLISSPDTDGTDTGAMTILTPDYASPEQVRGESISPKSDVYSLGAVLYELVSGVRAHRVKKYTPDAIEEAICRNPVAPPSDVAKDRSTARRLKGDLDHIVMRALEKDPAQRHESAAALAEDIRRYLGDLPVLAGPGTALYRARKFTRRHRPLVFASAALFVALASGTVMAIRQERDATAREQQLRNMRTAFVDAARELAAVDSRSGRDAAALARLNQALSVAEESISRAGSNATIDDRVLLPRIYGAFSVVHAQLGHADEAKQWRSRSLSAWKDLSTRPDFTDALQREMEAVEATP